ncbi:hypothetical protein ACOL24_07045 [Aliarcobacter butzleri]|uniref:Uncharacterized protein n=1 Tax=Aliarcobacter butzleri TaxID=28197 RepID=A0AAW6VR12_9BACT|nr:hypothetical protein [Aliarcobacter butzleri]MDK2063225.1 hypothetical protein [Aliarcobacter butzleri]MDK2071149.1 hypothetical protein [Aliarcobacter butzleri]
MKNRIKREIKKELANLNKFFIKLSQMPNNRRLNQLKQLLLKIKEIFITDLTTAKKILEEDGLMLFYILINRTIRKEFKC